MRRATSWNRMNYMRASSQSITKTRQLDVSRETRRESIEAKTRAWRSQGEKWASSQMSYTTIASIVSLMASGPSTRLDSADEEADDLPVIRENIRKGFLETQTKVNSFITNLKKKIDGEDEDDEHPPVPPPRPGTQGYGMRRSGEAARRSADRERYDADPEILGDDFTQIHMHDENSTVSLLYLGTVLKRYSAPTSFPTTSSKSQPFQAHAPCPWLGAEGFIPRRMARGY